MKIGITGHQEIANPTWVKRQILNILQAHPSLLVGVTSLAIGADQIFAQAVLDSGGELQVIVPFDGYADVFKAEGRKEYERLLNSASTTETLPEAGSHEESYFAAGKRVVDLSQVLIAIWNGKPAAGLGGTADVVEYARLRQKKYIHINPITQTVDDK